jgi:hypothetical protein
MYAAHKAGKADTDPSENWYQGELDFMITKHYPCQEAKEMQWLWGYQVTST